MRLPKWLLGSLIGLSAILAFFAVFKIEKLPVFGEGIAEITLELNKIVKHDLIHPTELLSVDLEQKQVSFRVQFPDEGWRNFSAREAEQAEGIGYIIQTIQKDKVVIWVPFPYHSYDYQLKLRWN